MDRPKRAAAQKKKKMSTAHWVGYVDDNETPEMIMKKFEELERIQRQKEGVAKAEKAHSKEREKEKGDEMDIDESFEGGRRRDVEGEEGNSVIQEENENDKEMEMEKDEDKDKDKEKERAADIIEDPMLDEAQLEELFKRTSVVHADDGAELELAYTFSGTDEPDGIFDDDEFDAKQALDEESDDDEDELFDMYRAKLIDDSRRRRRQSLSSEDDPYSLDNLSSASLPGDEDSSGAPVKESAAKRLTEYRQRRESYFDNSIVMGPLDFLYLRSQHRRLDPQHGWAVTLRPQISEDNPSPPSAEHIEADIRSFDFKSLARTFYAIHLDVPWQRPHSPLDETRFTLDDFRKLNLLKLAAFFVFIWIDKELQIEVFAYFEANEFDYIENLVWVKLTDENEFIADDRYPYQRSKCTLFMFKRRATKPKIQHQRNADVLFETARGGKYLTDEKPEAVYDVIETMLHEAVYVEGKQDGSLWARKGKVRQGWTMISQIVPDTFQPNDTANSLDQEANQIKEKENVKYSRDKEKEDQGKATEKEKGKSNDERSTSSAEEVEIVHKPKQAEKEPRKMENDKEKEKEKAEEKANDLPPSNRNHLKRARVESESDASSRKKSTLQPNSIGLAPIHIDLNDGEEDGTRSPVEKEKEKAGGNRVEKEAASSPATKKRKEPDMFTQLFSYPATSPHVPSSPSPPRPSPVVASTAPNTHQEQEGKVSGGEKWMGGTALPPPLHPPQFVPPFGYPTTTHLPFSQMPPSSSFTVPPYPSPFPPAPPQVPATAVLPPHSLSSSRATAAMPTQFYEEQIEEAAEEDAMNVSNSQDH